MASEVEVITHTWCDIHMLKDPNNTERVPSTWSGVVTLDKLRRQLDLCEPCRAEVIGDLHDVLATYGQKLDPAAAVKATEAARSTSVHDRPSARPDGKEHRCPRCEMEFASRSGLTQHARNVHGKPLAQLEADMGLPSSTGGQRQTNLSLFACPVCDQKMMGKAGLGSHLRTHKNGQQPLLKTG